MVMGQLQTTRFIRDFSSPAVGGALQTAGDQGLRQSPPEPGGPIKIMSLHSARDMVMGQNTARDSAEVAHSLSFVSTDREKAAQGLKAAANPSNGKTPPEDAGVTIQAASGVTAFHASGPIAKASARLAEGERAQALQRLKPLPPPDEGGANADITPAETGFASVTAPDALLAPNPQALGGSLPPHVAFSAQSSLPPKTAQALHAQVPAVIAHLQHGPEDDRKSHAEVLLNPAELGRIRFDLITQGDQVQVRLAVERPETLDLLRAHAETLRQEFRAAGLNTDTLNFGQWAQRAPPRDQREAAPPEPASPAALPPPISAPYVKPVSTTGLDLRL